MEPVTPVRQANRGHVRSRQRGANRWMTRWLTLGVFGLVLTVGPVWFGAVDRPAQVLLAALLAVGMYLRPPSTVTLPIQKGAGNETGTRLWFAFVAVVVLKELLPAAFFPIPEWRHVTTVDYRIPIAWTRHAEPALALDFWLTGALGCLWFFWARSMAMEREVRRTMAWIAAGAAVLFAAVCLVTFGNAGGSELIFGIRATPGWSGFGPFPNKNNSACLLAMGAVLATGCTVHAISRRAFLLTGVAVFGTGIVVAALLLSLSRGGLLAFGFGLLVFVGLTLVRYRSTRAWLAAAAGIGTAAAVVALFGSGVLDRFTSFHGGIVSNQTRLALWRDCIEMWRDAPLLGHGTGMFSALFPFYQKLSLEAQSVLHPESSWMQWLVELGALPVILAVGAAFHFFARQFRSSFWESGSFPIGAAAFAGFAALLAQSFVDVPGHKWGTTWFGLALLAVAFPARVSNGKPQGETHLSDSEGSDDVEDADRSSKSSPSSRQKRIQEDERAAAQAAQPVSLRTRRIAALGPLAVAVFWALPVVGYRIAWSPTSASQIFSRNINLRDVTLDEVSRALAWFPFNADLHETAGYLLLKDAGGRPRDTRWKRHFDFAMRLHPSQERMPAYYARVALPISPGLAVEYWLEAIRRAGSKADEVFRTAVMETAGSRVAADLWLRFVEAHPEFLLSYGQLVSEEDGKVLFQQWWRLRGQGAKLSSHEVANFYTYVRGWGTLAMFEEWAKRNKDLEKPDAVAWARIYHGWNQHERAWKLLSLAYKDVPSTKLPADFNRKAYEQSYELSPDRDDLAQTLIAAYTLSGEMDRARAMILAAASRPNAKPWFLRRAAYEFAAEGKYREAVEALLKERDIPRG